MASYVRFAQGKVILLKETDRVKRGTLSRIETRGTMRFFLIIASIITILTSQARAQAWMEYNYPDFGFAVSFPTDPTVESVPYKTTNGTALGEIMYSVQQEASVYSVTVIDFSSASVEEDRLQWIKRSKRCARTVMLSWIFLRA